MVTPQKATKREPQRTADTIEAMKREYCDIAARIIARQGNETVVLKNGDCTELYWHIGSCDACARLRSNHA